MSLIQVTGVSCTAACAVVKRDVRWGGFVVAGYAHLYGSVGMLCAESSIATCAESVEGVGLEGIGPSTRRARLSTRRIIAIDGELLQAVFVSV